MSRNFENIASINDHQEERNVSKILANSFSDDLECEIICACSELVCPTSLQRLTLPDNDEWQREQRKDDELNMIIRWLVMK